MSNDEQWYLSCIDGGNAKDIGILEDSFAFFFNIKDTLTM